MGQRKPVSLTAKVAITCWAVLLVTLSVSGVLLGTGFSKAANAKLYESKAVLYAQFYFADQRKQTRSYHTQAREAIANALLDPDTLTRAAQDSDLLGAFKQMSNPPSDRVGFLEQHVVVAADPSGRIDISATMSDAKAAAASVNALAHLAERTPDPAILQAHQDIGAARRRIEEIEGRLSRPPLRGVDPDDPKVQDAEKIYVAYIETSRRWNGIRKTVPRLMDSMATQRLIAAQHLASLRLDKDVDPERIAAREAYLQRNAQMLAEAYHALPDDEQPQITLDDMIALLDAIAINTERERRLYNLSDKARHAPEVRRLRTRLGELRQRVASLDSGLVDYVSVRVSTRGSLSWQAMPDHAKLKAAQTLMGIGIALLSLAFPLFVAAVVLTMIVVINRA